MTRLPSEMPVMLSFESFRLAEWFIGSNRRKFGRFPLNRRILLTETAPGSSIAIFLIGFRIIAGSVVTVEGNSSTKNYVMGMNYVYGV